MVAINGKSIEFSSNRLCDVLSYVGMCALHLRLRDDRIVSMADAIRQLLVPLIGNYVDIG
jgi:hypothetical protein